MEWAGEIDDERKWWRFFMEDLKNSIEDEL
jgi:hypothetical protein